MEVRATMSEWAKKIKDEAKGLIAEAEQELTALEGVDTVDLTADETDESSAASTESDSSS
ncbi:MULTISPECIES: hypothetical protein [Nocardiaceae]|uniref:hypothetical protein n=1 Tax=Nocardiaceae TaxID=85025 RepID=UPI0003AA0B71|nr:MULTISPECIES: hypothetical protein [Rhodococcus]